MIVLDRLAGGGVEIVGRLVEEEDFRIAREGAGKGQPLLLAAGKFSRRALGEARERDAFQQARDLRGRAFARARPAAASAKSTFAAALRLSITGR